MEKLEVTFKYKGIEFEHRKSITNNIDLYFDYDSQIALLVEKESNNILTIIGLKGDANMDNAYLDTLSSVPINTSILQKFNVTFKHSVLKDYKFVVEAYTMREARNKVSLLPFYEDCEVNIQPFNY